MQQQQQQQQQSSPATRDNATMPINQILIEHSSRLQVANFFILFAKRFVDTKSVKILLKPSEIEIHYDDGERVTLDLTEHFELETCSLSLLNIGGDNIVSFRLNTNNENSFRFEYLNLNNNNNNDSPDILRLKINVDAGEDFQIICSNCTCPLTGTVNYQRILELPSENLDLSEWFCHKHHSTAETTSTTNNHHPHHDPINAKEKFNFAKFNPRDTDLLFGQFFFLYNIAKLTNVKTKNNFLYCRRCLNFIGETVRDTTTKIWDENIKVLSKSETRCLFNGSSLYQNFYFIIRKNVQDFDFMSSAGLPSTNKILFETKDLDGRTTQFLLLQVMNKSLELFTLADCSNGTVSLRKLLGMKVFYRIESDETRPMVKFWQNDVGCSNIQISKKMFTVAVDTLNEYSRFVPIAYRNMGGFTISYLHV